ncbi:hypothetical protein [Stenotrophomonas rhizophila]|uniref:hypothetical protein n=1 Tax=Stenotrophomonas rhizophila TaxID=216778 RepID=UPI0028A5F28B|nr:hypothetical protein [Stenotrophomonas rhizophila]
MKYAQPGRRELIVNGQVIGWFEATGDSQKDLELARAKINELGHEQSPLPRWMLIRQQAMDFRDACGLIMNYDLGTRPPGRRPLSIPYVVNSAFCLELYLKALSLRHGNEQRGHDLLKLYDRLPQAAKTVIASRVPDAQQEAGCTDPIDVRGLLSLIKDNFEQWRYIHDHEELGTVPYDQLFLLRSLLHRACLNK